MYSRTFRAPRWGAVSGVHDSRVIPSRKSPFAFTVHAVGVVNSGPNGTNGDSEGCRKAAWKHGTKKTAPQGGARSQPNHFIIFRNAASDALGGG